MLGVWLACTLFMYVCASYCRNLLLSNIKICDVSVNALVEIIQTDFGEGDVKLLFSPFSIVRISFAILNWP